MRKPVNGVVLLLSFIVFLPETKQALTKIFDDGKNEFFTTLDKFVSVHPRRFELTGDDALRLHDARNQIPNLYERLMILAYQKDEPQFAEWICKGDNESCSDKGIRSSSRQLSPTIAERVGWTWYCSPWATTPRTTRLPCRKSGASQTRSSRISIRSGR